MTEPEPVIRPEVVDQIIDALQGDADAVLSGHPQDPEAVKALLRTVTPAEYAEALKVIQAELDSAGSYIARYAADPESVADETALLEATYVPGAPSPLFSGLPDEAVALAWLQETWPSWSPEERALVARYRDRWSAEHKRLFEERLGPALRDGIHWE